MRYSQESVGEAAANYLVRAGTQAGACRLPDDPRLADIAAERLDGVRRVLVSGGCALLNVPMDLDAARDTILTAVHRQARRRRRVRLQRRVRIDRAADPARRWHVGAGRHRSDGVRQSALRRADAAVPDDDRYRRHWRPGRRLSPRHVGGATTAPRDDRRGNRHPSRVRIRQRSLRIRSVPPSSGPGTLPFDTCKCHSYHRSRRRVEEEP